MRAAPPSGMSSHYKYCSADYKYRSADYKYQYIVVLTTSIVVLTTSKVALTTSIVVLTTSIAVFTASGVVLTTSVVVLTTSVVVLTTSILGCRVIPGVTRDARSAPISNVAGRVHRSARWHEIHFTTCEIYRDLLYYWRDCVRSTLLPSGMSPVRGPGFTALPRQSDGVGKSLQNRL